MGFHEKYAVAFRRVLPSPFTIAVLLSILTYFLALFFTRPEGTGTMSYAVDLMVYWESGLWDNNLLVFAVQMMLILVLGHVLALTKPFNWLIGQATQYCTNTSRAAGIVAFLTILVALFNWGLGLIFGAIFARKVAENAKENGYKINYPLVGAAGYVGLMVWHGGLSGSALAKVAEPNHLVNMMRGTVSSVGRLDLPAQITYAETVFSGLNIVVTLLLVTVIPAALFIFGKMVTPTAIDIKSSSKPVSKTMERLIGAEKLDHSKSLALYFSLVILGGTLIKAFYLNPHGVLGFFTPNNINFMLLGLGLLLHGNFNNFLKAVDEAISGVSGILIQFPLYFGIMGLMKNSGLAGDLSQFFVSVSSPLTYPVFTFISAGIVNFFVPSGGGQWAVQGPIIVQSSLELGVALPKSIMALAYGDQLTNMLQPFWALPLLGITGLKAKDILPYTLLLFLMGATIFLVCLFLL